MLRVVDVFADLLELERLDAGMQAQGHGTQGDVDARAALAAQPGGAGGRLGHARGLAAVRASIPMGLQEAVSSPRQRHRMVAVVLEEGRESDLFALDEPTRGPIDISKPRKRGAENSRLSLLEDPSAQQFFLPG